MARISECRFSERLYDIIEDVEYLMAERIWQDDEEPNKEWFELRHMKIDLLKLKAVAEALEKKE